jgi:SagB-type dehydrogenase family enzyme
MSKATLSLLILLAMGHTRSAGATLDRALVPQGGSVKLPAPAKSGTVSLEEALSRRRSIREFSNETIANEVLGQLLWAAQGVTHRDGYRTAPSAGALYPLELYAATAQGLFHYEPRQHRLTARTTQDVRPAIARAALSQAAVREAPLLLVFAAVYERTAVKYGERAVRYVHMEAGHAAQNALLQAAALGLGAVPVGAFDDARVARALGLPADERAVYVVAVGKAR